MNIHAESKGTHRPLLEILALHVREKHELSALPNGFVQRAVAEALRKHPKENQRLSDATLSEKQMRKAEAYQVIFKEARDILRKQHGMFSAKEARETKKRSELIAQLKDAPTRTRAGILRQLIMTHPSTAERAGDYERVYAHPFFGQRKGETLTILDLGAGLNVASLALDKRTAHARYLGYDISQDDADAIDAICKATGMSGIGRMADLSVQDDASATTFISHIRTDAAGLGVSLPFNVCLLWKTADVLEKQARGAILSIIRTVPARAIIVSFATRSLGQGKQFQRRRPWFEHLLSHETLPFTTFETSNEIFYCVTLDGKRA